MKSPIDRWLAWSSGLLASLALFGIMWLMLVDVIARKFWDHSVHGALEMTEILMAVVVFSALPLVSRHEEHIVFDSLDTHLPPRWRVLQRALVNLVCTSVFVFLAVQMGRRAGRFAEYQEVTQQLSWPMAPVAWVMAVFLVVTACVHLLAAFAPTVLGDDHA